MSFIKKAVKKVFDFTKKIVKSDIFKWVAIAALVFFTAGVAAGGFAAFAGVNTVGTFFVAVGQTMATGAAAMASGLGFQGVSGSLAQHGGAAAIQAGLTTSATSATGASLTANAAAGTITSTPAAGGTAGTLAKGGEAVALSAKGTAAANAAATGAGNLAAAESALGMTIDPGSALYQQALAGNVTSTGTVLEGMTNTLITAAPTGMSTGTKTVLLSGMMTGAQALLASRQADNEKGPTFVAGALSHDGGTVVSTPTITFGDKSANAAHLAASDTGKSSILSVGEEPSITQKLAEQPQDDPTNVFKPAELPAYRTLADNVEEEVPDDVQAVDGEAILAQADRPQFQATDKFFGRLPQSTQIAQRKSGQPVEDRLFGGSILGVS